MKTSAIIETEIRDYVKKLRKDRGEVTSVEVKKLSDYVKSPRGNPNFFVGGFVTFSNGDRIFVYRYENYVNNFANGRGYGTYSSYNSDRGVANVVNGWDSIGDPPY
jgi:hypothetical protein